MLEHKKRFTKKPVNAAPAQSAPAQPAETDKADKAAKTVKPAEPAKVASKKAVAPAPKVAVKPAAKEAVAPKVAVKPAAPKAAPKAEAPKVEAPKSASKPAAPKKVSLPEETLAFFANLILWVSIGIGALFIAVGIGLAFATKNANSFVMIVGAVITAAMLVIYPLIIWAFTKVFVNISNTLKSIDAKLPAPKEKVEK